MPQQQRPETAADVAASNDSDNGRQTAPKQIPTTGVGVPKREPCRRCQLPVFLAERLLHDGRLYHRTCLRCARCGEQLTPGSFYETEADGEYCCETCPDEERRIAAAAVAAAAAAVAVEDTDADAKPLPETPPTSAAAAAAAAAVLQRRQSFSHKLALFQARSSGLMPSTADGPADASAAGKGVLAKSLSDEEKSKSLKRLTALYSMHAGVSSPESVVRASLVRRQLLADVVAQADGNVAAHEVDEEDDEEEEEEEEEDDDDEDEEHGAAAETDQDDDVKDEMPALPTVAPPQIADSNTIPIQTVVSQPDATTDAITVADAFEPVEQTAPTPTVDSQAVVVTVPTSPIPEKSSTDLNEPTQHDDREASTTNTSSSLIASVEPTETHPSPVTKEETTATVPVSVVPTPRKRVLKPQPAPVDDASSSSPVRLPPVPRERSATKAPEEEAVVVVVVAAEEPANKSAASYPPAFNPFGDDDDEEPEQVAEVQCDPMPAAKVEQRRHSYNPFDSSDDEIELDKLATLKATATATSSSLNPFGSDDDDDDVASSQLSRQSSGSNVKRTPVPTPRKCINASASTTPSASMQTTPETVRRSSMRTTPSHHPHQYHLGSSGASSSSYFDSPQQLHRNSQLYGSVSSLASTASALNAYTRRHKRRAPLPPSAAATTPQQSPPLHAAVSSASLAGSVGPSPSGSGRSTPNALLAAGSAATLTLSRKKRAAPKPPTAASSSCSAALQFTSSGPATQTTTIHVLNVSDEEATIDETGANSTTPQLSPIPASPTATITPNEHSPASGDAVTATIQTPPHRRKLITLDASLLDTPPAAATVAAFPTGSTTVPIAAITASAAAPNADDTVVYRRTIMPNLDDDDDDEDEVQATVVAAESHDRQWQKVKENKESLNKNRQSQLLLASASASSASASPSSSPESVAHDRNRDRAASPAAAAQTAATTAAEPSYNNKSTFGKWKRRKASAPPPPILASSCSSIVMHDKKAAAAMGIGSSSGGGGVQMLPLTDIRYELEVIEVQQQGLEKQGIQLEKMIRERCEGGGTLEPAPTIEEMANAPNTKEVEDLILQLFEIVNEKNELFRRQAELMYLRRLHRLEQEQAEIEYDIRLLMEQPESNKTDSDKAREDSLIARKIEIVLQRNEVIDCLECDRLREAEEDESIKTRLDEHNARWDEAMSAQLHVQPAKLSKKEKKKLRETKKLAKQKKMDADKDADESEMAKQPPTAEKKKKRKFLF